MSVEPEESCRRCGHERDAHEHFRRGSDCALCDCPSFRGGGLLGRLRGLVGDR